MARMPILIASTILLTSPSYAIVGGAAPSVEGLAQAVVTIVGSRGNFCTGSLLAPKLVLTAAHCVQPGSDYKIVDYDEAKTPHLGNVRRVAVHPAFQMEAMGAHRATADLALLELESPARGKIPSKIGAPLQPISPGAKFTVAGVGVTVRGDGRSAGTVHMANLIATGKPGSLQLRLVDPLTSGTSEGLGACTGDSGGPVFEDERDGSALVGVISWSTGPSGSAGCGGLTGITPLTLYRDWVLQTARKWGFVL